ncbi:hypothetical protein [Streptomyces sp. CC210A]|uniref:hypothetical protein n=1 Tax=Streptomyces sp. CC210A TaxID=2898184 RepID=UPI001F2675AF|nr:hypothetical protein [Streptomyces sp. CC210A]
MQLPLDASQSPVALESDEYGNVRTGSPAARYGWLGAFQRSSETPTDTMLMGAAPLARHRTLDATVFKVVYGGARRTETSTWDVVDLGRNPKVRQFGRYCTLNVRYGRAKNGWPPRRWSVRSVMDWAGKAVADDVENARPRFGVPRPPGSLDHRTRRTPPALLHQRPVRGIL